MSFDDSSCSAFTSKTGWLSEALGRDGAGTLMYGQINCESVKRIRSSLTNSEVEQSRDEVDMRSVHGYRLVTNKTKSNRTELKKNSIVSVCIK